MKTCGIVNACVVTVNLKMRDRWESVIVLRTHVDCVFARHAVDLAF